MEYYKIEDIFEREKADLLSGKSGLAKAILRQFPDKDFLFVNGEIFTESFILRLMSL